MNHNHLFFFFFFFLFLYVFLSSPDLYRSSTSPLHTHTSLFTLHHLRHYLHSFISFVRSRSFVLSGLFLCSLAFPFAVSSSSSSFSWFDLHFCLLHLDHFHHHLLHRPSVPLLRHASVQFIFRTRVFFCFHHHHHHSIAF